MYARALCVCRVLCAAATALSAVPLTADAGEGRRPNILLIVGDDMGYADVGFHGCQDIPTPNLDALAASGVRFTNGYVSGPCCSPTRAGLMTGRYQTRFGHEFNPTDDSRGLPLSEKTLADRLKAAGYATGLVGKWHLGVQPKFHPHERGFTEFFGFLAGAHDYFNSTGILRGTEPAGEQGYLTDAIAREAVAFIERHRAEPWFLYVSFNAVHKPMEADDARLNRFAGIADETRRTYAAMMVALDEAVGLVLDKVADDGLGQDTFVVFLSDNGGQTAPGSTVHGSQNAPLRGSKKTTLEGGIRVPFLVSWPGHLLPGVYDQPVIQLDANATALVAAGVAIKPEWKLDGVDLLPFLRGENDGKPHDALYWRFGEQMAVRQGDYKLVRYDTVVDAGRDDRPHKVSGAKLYRLSDDIGESKDLAAAMPERVRELQARWDAWNATLVKPLWIGGGRSDRGDHRSSRDR
jgi:arylsulfatase A-like enzyme